ncbi:MAG: hypothetical protein DRP64_16045 [Verrucomicrobia bacterium]|nr:MAG: hypothetical protein DRP64_16045 [Verrucomicrobiota bacterium]
MKHENGETNRRQFIKTSGAMVAGLTVVGCATQAKAGSMNEVNPFPAVSPESVNVDPGRLQAAIDFLDEEFAKGSFPGVSLVATRHGETFLEEYRGTYCDGQTRDVPVDGQQLNMVYSFSKVITATVVVMVHQDGLLDYDAPVSTYLPGFKDGGKDKITLRQCLTHSAGIPSVQGMGPVLNDVSWQKNVDAVCAHETEWAPGSKTAYHGLSGAFVAAACARTVCGMKPWNEICRERLFDPLGAKSMTFGLPPADAQVALTPQPKNLPTPLDPAHFAMVGHPGGGGFARAEDMLRLLNMHLNGGVWNGKRLIGKDAFAEMHRVQYAKEIEAAVAAGKAPSHEFWALGWLTRGTTKTGWFGFGDTVSEDTYGHAGIDTVIGLADPKSGLALTYLTANSPKSVEETTRMRNEVTNLVAKSLKG